MNDLASFLKQNIKDLEYYFIKTKTLVFIVIDENMIIKAHNKCFSSLISSGRRVSGKPIDSFLLSESKGILPFDNNIREISVHLNFMSSDSSPVCLQCSIFKIDNNGYMILGGNLMLTNDEALLKMTVMSNEMANMARDLHRQNRELKKAHEKIKILSGIVPICMHCKGVRDDKGYWKKLENYITEHSEAEFSHGICDDCLKKYYGDDLD